MQRILLLAVGSSLLLASCQNNRPDAVSNTPDAGSAALVDAVHPGQKLMETNCYLCHSPSAPETEGRVGPPMAAIKAYYWSDGISQEAFTRDIISFLEAPSVEKAKMKDAVERFGLMPYQHFSNEIITQIADFMYNYQIEEPDWFKAHWEAQHGTETYVQRGKKIQAAENAANSIEDIGLEYALGTKKVLGENLMKAIQTQGALHAMEFCNARAIPLTDSMSRHYNADIRRVSDKNRNPGNKADAEELKYIAQFKKQIAAGEEPAPVVLQRDGMAQFYYPITTNSMCLQCHGKTKDILPEVRSKIATLYPKDLATGYAENEVRGIWSITLKDKK